MDQFTPNIFIQESECFGTPCYPIITSFLYMVDRNMMAALEQAPFSTRECIVLYKEEGPMCSLIGDCHLVFLAVRDNYWCQWVYQFAHEYCHPFNQWAVVWRVVKDALVRGDYMRIVFIV